MSRQQAARASALRLVFSGWKLLVWDIGREETENSIFTFHPPSGTHSGSHEVSSHFEEYKSRSRMQEKSALQAIYFLPLQGFV